MIHGRNSKTSRKPLRRGYTLLEVMIVSTIIIIMASIPVPLFTKAIEQSKLDMAAANLRSIWCAERYYFLEKSQYGALADLLPSNNPEIQSMPLLDPSIGSGTTYYTYSITFPTSDRQRFLATALHPSGSRYSGSMTIDETGQLNCQVSYATSSGNVYLTPSMEAGL